MRFTTEPRSLLLAAALTVLLVACTTTQTTTTTPVRETTTVPDESNTERRGRVRLELASAYFAQGQTSTALEEVNRALKAEPNLFEAYNLRGLIYARMGDQVRAEEGFRRALELNAHDGDTLHNYAWFQCALGRFDPAQKLFAQALQEPQYQQQRQQVRTLLLQGVCRARAGQWVEAEQSLNRAFELDPANVAVSMNLSQVLYQRGDLDRARFYIRRVNSLPDASTAESLWLAMRIENRAGNRQVVADLGQQLRSRFPQSPEAASYERSQFDE